MPRRHSRRRLLQHTRMRRFMSSVTIILCLPFQSLYSVIPISAHAASTIIIQEIAWAGSSVSIADEWIELANLGDATSTVSGWILKGASASGTEIILPENAEIPPRGTYLIANYPETDEKSSLLLPVQYATTALSLSNSKLQIELSDQNGQLRDEAGNGSAPFAGNSDSFTSMIRTQASSGNQADAWISATSTANFKSNIQDKGTPGFCDICIIPEIHAPSEQSFETPIETTNLSATSTENVMSDSVIIIAGSVSSTSASTRFSVFLNEAFSNPVTGSEWVELEFSDEATSTDRELTLHDSQTKIATIPSGTPLTAPPYLLIQLPSAKLNNSGDELSVRENDGLIIDRTMIPALEKNRSWARDPEIETWNITELSTPAAENNIYISPPPISITKTVIVTESTPTSLTDTKKTTADATITASPPAPPIPVSLNEIVSNPSSGPEWIELFFSGNSTSTDRVLVLKDAKGSIKSVPAFTPLTLPHYLVIPLSGSKITNGGESISLAEASGTIIEVTNVPKLAKGESWMKAANGAWSITSILTPAAENQQSNPEIEPAPSVSTEASQTQTTTESSDELLDDLFTAAEESNQSQTAQPVKAASTSKTSNVVTTYPFSDMFNESLDSVRVRVNGTVASVPKLFGTSHVFILQNEDGRGLIVYAPTSLHIPPFGTTVRVDGTLSSTEYGPQIRMKKTDHWMTMATSTAPQPRTVDLLAPGSEDAWSLVAVQGNVTSIGTSSFTIETEDAVTITVSAPVVAGFRTKRLVKGDVVTVVGLLNIKKTSPTIIIRTADDVTLVRHAPESVTISNATSTSGAARNRFPDWVPFASAGAAIIGTGGAKRLKEEMKKRKLKKMAKREDS